MKFGRFEVGFFLFLYRGGYVGKKGIKSQSEYGADETCVTFFFFRTFLKVFVTALATSPCPFPPHLSCLQAGPWLKLNFPLLRLARLVSVSQPHVPRLLLCW